MPLRKSIVSNPTVVDLFSGAGLLSYAFLREGFSVVRAIEWERIAAETYAHNLGPHVECEDVRKVTPSGRCDVLVAGPPCQGFSTLNQQRTGDRRRTLTLEVARWASVLRPKIVVVENVANFVGTYTWKNLVRRLEALGYNVTFVKCNALDFGVPQRRLRSFTFASKIGDPDVIPLRFSSVRNVAEAWDGLPKFPDGKNNHFAPTPSELTLKRFCHIPYGGDKRDVMRHAPELAPPSWWSVGCEATDVWGRMTWESPSNTLRTNLYNPSKGRYVHPEQNRVISLREAARLHSISDSWEFVGKHTQVARQIGNSVPPRLGRAVARAVYRFFV